MRRLSDLEAKLARLEKLAGKDSCPACRLGRQVARPDQGKPKAQQSDPTLLATETCEHCGGKREVDLSAYPEEEREIYRICYEESSLEALYTNPRAWAASEWLMERLIVQFVRKKKFTGAKRENKGGKPSPEAKLYVELRDRWNDAQERKRKRLVARYGEKPFPDLAARLEGVKSKDRGHLYKGEAFGRWVSPRLMADLAQDEESWMRCAEAEKFLLGYVLASTHLALEDCDRRASELIEEGRRLHGQEEERRRQREAGHEPGWGRDRPDTVVARGRTHPDEGRVPRR